MTKQCIPKQHIPKQHIPGVLCSLLLLAACGRTYAAPPVTTGSKPKSVPHFAAIITPTAAPDSKTQANSASKLIALDPGHGGEDLGARHFNHQDEMDLHESTVTLKLSLKIGEKLQARGYRVFYVRQDDSDPNLYETDSNGDGEINLRDVVQTRTDMVNESGADLLLSVHMNAWETDDVQLRRETGGIETYYCSDRPFAGDNLRFANLVHQNLIATLTRLGDHDVDRGVRPDHDIIDGVKRHLMILGPEDDVIVRASRMPGILSEPMFITCDREAALMMREDALDALADAYVNAIDAYFAGKG